MKVEELYSFVRTHFEGDSYHDIVSNVITSLKEEKPRLYEKFGLSEVKDTVYRMQKDGISEEGNYNDEY
jgi:hypothetical protein